MKRYLVEPIHQDLKEKMVFLGGPRQVGKTTLALGLIKGANETHPAYLNWDVRATQKLILQGGLPAQLLPDRVGSLLSLNNLRQDLSVAYETADKWITILENLYYCFRIVPYGLPHLRAVKKEKKLYLWDWSLCQDESVRFESMVASHLLKYCHFIEDTEGDDMSLHFMRDSTGREIDFVVNRNGKPAFAVECKTGSHTVSKNIAYFSTRTDIPCYYQVHMGDKDYELAASNTRVIPFTRFCQLLKL